MVSTSFLEALIKEIREIKEELSSLNTGVDVLSYSLNDIANAMTNEERRRRDEME